MEMQIKSTMSFYVTPVKVTMTVKLSKMWYKMNNLIFLLGVQTCMDTRNQYNASSENWRLIYFKIQI